MPNYVVSGAATSVINGTYTQHPTYSNLWVKGSYYLSHDSGPQSDYDYQWWLRTDSNIYYYNTSTSSTPPLTGWILGGIATAGAVPTIAEELVDPYCVAGAGTTIANGTYSFNSGSYNMFMSGYWQHITEPNLKMGYGMMGSYQIFNDSSELYYASSLTGTWSVSNGSASAPTVTAGACGATPAPTVTSISPSTGTTAGGTSVTITGTNLTGATAVTIRGVNATNVSVVSSTSITATTPAGTAGTASVLVTTPNGTNASNSLFTFVAPSPSPSPSPSPTTANIIRPKRSSTASAVPSSLQPYELAVNISDKRIWVADASGTPVLMSELNDLPSAIDGGTF